MILQIGEKDTAYDRHLETVRFAAKLQKEREVFLSNFTEEADYLKTQGYIYRVHVHKGKPHNFYDNDPHREPQKVFAKPFEWLEDEKKCDTEMLNTNSIDFVSSWTRNSYPVMVRWDLGVRATSRAETLANSFYWLSIEDRNPECQLIEALLGENVVVVRKMGAFLRVYLSQQSGRWDSTRTFTAHILSCEQSEPGATVEVSFQLTPKISLMAKTLAQRHDPNYAFEAYFDIERVGVKEDGSCESATVTTSDGEVIQVPAEDA